MTPGWVNGLCLFAVIGWMPDAMVAVGIRRFNVVVDQCCSEIDERLCEKQT